MKNLKLNDMEKILLLSCLEKHDSKLIEQLEKLYSNSLDKITINEMREAVGTELQEKGFKPDWEPNEYGLRLESLIDKLRDLYSH